MRILLIVPHDELKLLEFLEKKFKDDQDVVVMHDRPASHRRKVRWMRNQERRRHDRRGASGDRLGSFMLLRTEATTTTPST